MKVTHIKASLNSQPAADPSYCLPVFVRFNLPFRRQDVADLVALLFALLSKRNKKRWINQNFQMKSISNQLHLNFHFTCEKHQ